MGEKGNVASTIEGDLATEALDVAKGAASGVISDKSQEAAARRKDRAKGSGTGTEPTS